ncbi:MAG: glycosyltransferase [Candidatus Udaeobacter sp.]
MTGTPAGQGKVSIVIPCYNHGAMLLEALASIEQVRNENLLEVIVVDDGSSDTETIEILGKLAKARYRVVCQPSRSGPGGARNTAIRLARGEFILPLDSDNRLRDVYLNEGVALLKNNPSISVIYTDAEYFGERSGRWHVPDFDFLSLIRMSFIDTCALYRKNLWEEVGGYDEQIVCWGVEDWDFWLRVASHGGSFVHLPKIGFDYHVRKDSMVVRARLRVAESANYIFGKPELGWYRLVRDMNEQAQRIRSLEDLVRRVQGSRSYRLGRGLLAPARLLRKLWGYFD